MPVTASGGARGVLPSAPLVCQKIEQAASKFPVSYQYMDSTGTLQSTPDPTTAVAVNGQYAVVDSTNNVVLTGQQAGATYDSASATASGSGGAVVHVPSTAILSMETAQSSATPPAPAAVGLSVSPLILLAGVGLIAAVLLL